MKKATAVFLVLMMLLSGCTQTPQESQDIETSNHSTGTIDGTDDPTEDTVPNEQTTAPDTTQPSENTTQTTTPATQSSESTASTDPTPTQPSESTTPTDPTPSGALYIDLTAQKSNASYKTVVIKNNCFTITEGGTYRVYGTAQNGRIVVDTSKDAKVELIFDGASITCSNYAPLYIKQADKVTISLADGTQNKLENGGSFSVLDENNVDAALFSKDDITITGSGSLSVKSPGGHGITGKDVLTIKGGTITVNASRHALEANDSITISGGTLTLTAGEDGIHTENDEDSALGIFTQTGGSVTIYATDDGVHAVASLTVSSGSLKIEKCFEGLEAAKIYIKSGNVYVNAADDGINATAGADINCYNGEAIISISGGKTEIITQGDALDSNGDLFLSGGEVVCHGPGNTVHGYGTLDFVNKAIVTGGRLIAFTSSGKAFSEDSAQAAFHLNFIAMKAKGTSVTVTDANGNLLFSDIAETGFNCIIVSAPELTVGSRYTVTVGDAAIEVNQRKLITKAKENTAQTTTPTTEAAVPSETPSSPSEDTTTPTQEAAGSMTRQTYDGLNYWLYAPAKPTANMPLIVYLHGGSGKGEDLNLLTDVDGFPQYVKDGRIACNAYIVFPQCPSDQKGWKTMGGKIEALINYTCNTYDLNANRVSLTGHSMGGTGTWTLALSRPELFYKIAPMSGSVTVSDSNLAKLSSIPVWAVVGDKDKIVSPDTSIAMIDALRQNGANATITVLEGATHFDVPGLGYLSTDVVNWLIT